MKKLFFAFAIFFSVAANAQLQIPHSVKVVSNESGDWKYGPWATTTSAKTNVPIGLRVGGLTVYILSCSCEYWWLDTDLTDSGLLAKTGGGSGDALTSNPLSQFASTTSLQLKGVLSDETGSGAAVFATSPTLVTPILGTPTSATLTNATGLPLSTGVTGTLPVANGGTGTTTPALVAGTNVTITGTWPNQTINSSGGGGTVSLNGFTFSPADDMDPTFITYGAGIAITDSPTVGNVINWSFLETADHHSLLFDSIYANNSKILEVHYPSMRNVINFTAVPDETFAGALVWMGGSVQLTNGLISAYQPGSLGIRLTYSGSGSTWTITGTNSGLYSFSLGPYYGLFNVGPVISLDYDAMNITYVGPHNRHIKRLYSGLGSYNAAFVVLDSISAIPTLDSRDEVVITGGGIASTQLNLYRWNTSNQFMSGFGDIWIHGTFEAWMVAAPISTTSIRVRYQTRYKNAMHVAATTYKIYRDTHKSFCCATLIYTGTAGTFDDTSLTADTLYYYKLVATVSGVDVDVSTFRSRTLK